MSRKRKSLAAEGFDFVCRCFQILRLAAGNDHFGSRFRESKCYRLTYAAAASGDYGYFSF
jgi:hypothetical protein